LEERFTRKKHDCRFPHHALAYCLDEGGITLGDVDYVAFFDKPFLKFERLLENLSHLRTQRLSLIPNGDPTLVEREVVSEAAVAR
jgi:predicted NodU family carbamoyl transferase